MVTHVCDIGGEAYPSWCSIRNPSRGKTRPQLTWFLVLQEPPTRWGQKVRSTQFSNNSRDFQGDSQPLGDLRGAGVLRDEAGLRQLLRPKGRACSELEGGPER